MARGKKKESALTPEEKLAQALVPVEEQPYQIPGNWCWTTVGSVCSFVGGGTPDKSNPEYWGGDIPWASVKDVKGSKLYDTVDRITQAGLEHSASNLCQKGELILVTRIEPGKAIVSEIVTAINQDLKVVKSHLDASFLFYYFQTFQHKFEEKASGSTVKGITIPNVQGTVFPLPPLAEQQRIVDRIEYLFAKLDEAKEKAQSVLDSFETRKAAILHKAFTGELTAKWRSVHGKGLSEWRSSYLKECCQIGSGGTPSRKNPEYYKGSIPWIKTGEIDWNEIDDAEEKISNAAIENSSAKLYEPGAVLVAMYGMGVTRGRAAILRVPAATNQAVCVLQPKDDLLNRYLFYYFMCNYWDIREQAVGGNQLNLSGTIIGKFQISIPTLEEQIEIVRILDSLFAKEQQAKEAAEAVLEKIDLLKKSILARAFRGELGTNDPTEESALELLKNNI